MAGKEKKHEEVSAGDWGLFLATVHWLVNDLEMLVIQAKGNGASSEDLYSELKNIATKLEKKIKSGGKSKGKEGEKRITHCSYLGWDHCSDGTCAPRCR